ncbi:MAG: hypothetical protein K8F36_02925 [Melioribacteraceae bacterium]|nr:hypothetical protein [Melioribacteraceae bacterium]
MKRGCLLKFILLIPVFIGIAYYVGGRYGKQVADRAIIKFEEEFNDYLEDQKLRIIESEYLDSVKIYVGDYLGELSENELKEVRSGKDEMIEFVKQKLSDISLDSADFLEIKKKFKNYGRTKEN